MMLNVDLLAQEADRLVERAGRQLRELSSKQRSAGRARDGAAMRERVHRLRLKLQRLELYRAVVKRSRNSHAALLPEYLEATGLLPARSDTGRPHRCESGGVTPEDGDALGPGKR